VFFIEFVLLFGGLPESGEVVIFSFLVLPHLKMTAYKFSNPVDCPVLLGPFRALVEVVSVRKELRRSRCNRVSITVIPSRTRDARGVSVIPPRQATMKGGRWL
jgi:hypothetical protein